VTGDTADRAALLRFVVAPDGSIVPDVEARLPGRGLWLTPRRDIIERAAAKRLFSRAARRPVTTPADLASRVEVLLARRCVDELGLARRSGSAVAGFDRVGETVRQGKAALLLFALDGGENGRRKLGSLGQGLPWGMVLKGDELAAAFGRDRVAHVAVGAGALCERLMRDVRRLAGFRSGAAVETDLAPGNPASQDGGIEANG